MQITWVKRAMVAALVALTTSAAWAANWQDNLVETGPGGTVTITSTGTQKVGVITNDDAGLPGTGTGDNRTGGLALRIRPQAVGAINAVTASNLTVNGYSTTINWVGTDDSNAYGPLSIGGLSGGAQSILTTTLNSVNLTNNTTTFNVNSTSSTDESPSAFGGAADFASAGTISYRNGTISGNRLTLEVQESGVATKAHVNGGGLSIRDQFTASHSLSGMTFNDNASSLTRGSSATDNGGTARGGALFVQNTNDENKDGTTGPATPGDQNGTDITISGSRFTNNRAINTYGGMAQGGAVALDMGVRAQISNTTFEQNSANGASAQGGALHIDLRNSLTTAGAGSTYVGKLAPIGTEGGAAYHTKVTNSTFTGNYAQGNGSEGGAIYTRSGVYVSGTTFSGNYTVDADGTSNRRSNAIHLAAPRGNSGGFNDLDGSDGYTSVIFADAAGSSSYDYDGISSDGATSRIVKSGAGNLYLYGNYDRFQGDVVSLQAGTTYFAGDQRFSAATMTLGAGAGASLANSSRAGNVEVAALALSGSSLTAKVRDAATGTTDHFVAAGALTGYDTPGANTYRVAGQMQNGQQYVIAEGASASFASGTQYDSVAGLYNNYNVYTDNNAVWAESFGAARSLAGYATTSNARNLANYMSQYGGNLRDYFEANYGASNGAEINRFLSMAAGEGHASANSAAAAYGRFTSTTILQQAMNGWASFYGPGGGTVGTSSSEPEYSSSRRLASSRAYGAVALDCPPPATRIWATGTGYYQDGDDSDSFKAKTRGWGLSIGADRVFGDWLVGAAFQYTDNRMKINDLGHRTDFDAYTLALYGGRRIAFSPGTLYINGGITGTWYDLDSQRHDGLGGRYSADYDGSGFGAFLDGGFAFRVMETVELQPFANLTWNSFWNDGYTENRHGGVGNNLRVRSDHQGNLFQTLGVRGRVQFAYNFEADANIGWRHTYGPKSPTTRTSFSGFGGVYNVQGSALARDEAAYGVGLTFRPVSNVAIRAAYDGSAGNGSVSHRGSLNVGVSF